MYRTVAVVRVAVVLMANRNRRHWILGVAEAAGVPSATVRAILGRMHAEGWLVEMWRGQRRYYVLTDSGRAALDDLLLDARADLRFMGIPGLV